jgi:putative PIG3 family NAD(P)H quinone oxidoreductase
MEIEEIPEPPVGPYDVLVDIRCSALNRADLLQVMGGYANPHPEDHEIPGMEFAGTVAVVGTHVTEWQPGDEVMAITSGGGYAERIVAHERQLIPVPRGVALKDAAAIPEVFLTAWDALVLQGGLTSGRWALVHAGGSGVGTAGIQIVKALGGNVIVTCSSGKVAKCLALGADVAVDYRTHDFLDEVLEVTCGRGVDVVLDVVGGDYTERNLRATAARGRIVQVGLMGGGHVDVDVSALMMKRISWVGTVLRSRPVEEKIALAQRFGREVVPLFESGRLRPVIDARFPLARIAEAHAYMASNANVGKIIVDV